MASKVTSAGKNMIQKITDELNKKFGADTIVTASHSTLKIQRLPTGILSFDQLIGGGFCRNRHTELFGHPSTGKTTIAIKAIAHTQQAGGQCCFIDSEATFDPEYATNLGASCDDLTYHRQRHGNQVINVLETLLRSGEYDLIVVDSIAALIPMQEIERDMEQGSYGMQQAKLMSEALRRLTAANTGRTAMVYLNQTRENVGGSPFGPKFRTSGGRAMLFYGTLRIEFSRSENIKRKVNVADAEKGMIEKEIVRGHRVVCRIAKAKEGGGKEQDTASLVYDYELNNIDPIEDIIFVGLVRGIIKRTGNTWSIGKATFHGRPKLRKFLSDAQVQARLKEKLS